jgi:hypothetical protein
MASVKNGKEVNKKCPKVLKMIKKNKFSKGNVKKHAGGGQKINILLTELEKYKNDQNKIIVFTDRFFYFFLIIKFNIKI